MDYSLNPIAIIHSPFKEKFATPRQAGLAPTVTAEVVFFPDYATPEAVRGLSEFSHIWLLFLFHHNWQKGWQPTVRPPRLGGNKRVGVYASRSPFRPNPIGLSAVRLLSVIVRDGQVVLKVQGADLIDQTPIIDIKPYLPYGDAISGAAGGFAPQAPSHRLAVEFSSLAQEQLARFRPAHPELEALLHETLGLDPRPAYRSAPEDEREYGVRLLDYNIRWQVSGGRVMVLAIDPVEQ
ncbi:tRNA (N6-threonylcarbamoyladenosine(37)-N6)-methyltransferase TrmO [Pelobacter seleniigenes]|uniref:tRNA (N6-threonylcarbamoyladenosine(37)-N6)-methyltransferase TrmO n=1 Tax=Pelobacter seleniigenes TaxID=407188 RepID=UPI0004A72549|nr:tRNA (N6-threonylcarbamoyladenosine(37)-N6)-methyltransferase TrmO [Pelobacter seleniigenes]